MKLLTWLWRGPRWLAVQLLIGMVYGYRLVIRPWLPPSCRFEPSCSEYFLQAVRQYGPIRGTLKGLWRISRCNPWCQGGYDPP